MESNATIIQFDLLGQDAKVIEPEAVQYDFSKYLYWVHLDVTDVQQTTAFLAKLNLSIESFQSQLADVAEEAFPFLEEESDSLSLRLTCLTNAHVEKDRSMAYSRLVVYLTSQYCLTMSKGMPNALAMFKKEFKKSLEFAETPGFILFLLLDNIVNEYLDALLALERIADDIELDYRHISSTTYRKVLSVKRRVITVRRYITLLADIIMRISGRKIHVISDKCRDSLQSLLAHCQLIMTEADAIRDSINSSLEAINNALMGRMNETMRILTVYMLFFMPLTLITGIYGMNFDFMPELHWKYGYFMALGLMAASVGILFYAFKRRHWL